MYRSLILRIVVISLAVVVISNLAFLNVSVFQLKDKEKSQNSTVVVNSLQKQPVGCDKNCLDQIYQTIQQATTAAQQKVILQKAIQGSQANGCDSTCQQAIYQAIYQATVSAIPTIGPSSNSQVKEYFISIGSGTNATDDWLDVDGVEITLNGDNYPSNRTVTFEPTLFVPTGNEKAYARLFNVTDKHPVWFSEVSVESTQAKLLISSPIVLDSGSKTYRVQMKTGLKATANLAQSRIHIAVNQ